MHAAVCTSPSPISGRLPLEPRVYELTFYHIVDIPLLATTVSTFNLTADAGPNSIVSLAIFPDRI